MLELLPPKSPSTDLARYPNGMGATFLLKVGCCSIMAGPTETALGVPELPDVRREDAKTVSRPLPLDDDNPVTVEGISIWVGVPIL